ncbi:hypothetical protein SCLARK_001814 [Spiroplasma clarkii]|nr:hypothetical protein SCLARK_001814 [Spiroplasma clarkii]
MPLFEFFNKRIINENEQTVFSTNSEESKESYTLFHHINEIMIVFGSLSEVMFENHFDVDLLKYMLKRNQY